MNDYVVEDMIDGEVLKVAIPAHFARLLRRPTREKSTVAEKPKVLPKSLYDYNKNPVQVERNPARILRRSSR